MKIALSLRRFGFRSLVLEGGRSRQDFGAIGLEVFSLGLLPQLGSVLKGKARSRYTKVGHGFLGNWLRLVVFCGDFLRRYLFVPFRRLPRADLYYVHSYEFLPLALTRRRGARVVYDAHDYYQDIVPIQEQSYFVKHYLLPLMGRIEGWTARRCDAVVTVSAGVSTAFSERYGLAPVVVMNAVDRRNNRNSPTTIRKALQLSWDEQLLVMVGNRKIGFKFDFAAAILRQMPNLHIAFVGRGFDGAAGENRHLGVERQLHFVSAVPASEVSAFIGDADAGLLLYRPISRNYRSALPNGFFHAVDALLPVARFALPEIEAIIGTRMIGPVLDSKDPTIAAQQLDAFLSDPVVRSQCVNDVAAFSQEFNWAAQEASLRAACLPS